MTMTYNRLYQRHDLEETHNMIYLPSMYRGRCYGSHIPFAGSSTRIWCPGRPQMLCMSLGLFQFFVSEGDKK